MSEWKQIEANRSKYNGDLGVCFFLFSLLIFRCFLFTYFFNFHFFIIPVHCENLQRFLNYKKRTLTLGNRDLGLCFFYLVCLRFCFLFVFLFFFFFFNFFFFFFYFFLYFLIKHFFFFCSYN